MKLFPLRLDAIQMIGGYKKKKTKKKESGDLTALSRRGMR
jgi:hypothetical protein